MNSIHIQIVTPERTLLDTEVDSITCTTTLGQVTILPGHVQLVSTLIPGELVVRMSKETKTLHVGGGMLKVSANSEVVILADAAEHIGEIDEQRAAEALARAEERLASEQLGDREYAATTALLERNLARLRIVRKHAHRRKASISGEGVLEE